MINVVLHNFNYNRTKNQQKALKNVRLKARIKINRHLLGSTKYRPLYFSPFPALGITSQDFFHHFPHSELRLKIFFTISRARNYVSRFFLPFPVLGITSQDFFCQFRAVGFRLRGFFTNFEYIFSLSVNTFSNKI